MDSVCFHNNNHFIETTSTYQGNNQFRNTVSVCTARQSSNREQTQSKEKKRTSVSLGHNKWRPSTPRDDIQSLPRSTVCFRPNLPLQPPIAPSDTTSTQLQVLPSPGDAVGDGPVRAGRHPLHRHAGDRLLDVALDVRRDVLHAALDGRLEEGDVALPARGPVGCLGGEALRGAGHHHVEGREGGGAGGAEEEDLGPAGCGDADRHFVVVVVVLR